MKTISRMFSMHLHEQHALLTLDTDVKCMYVSSHSHVISDMTSLEDMEVHQYGCEWIQFALTLLFGLGVKHTDLPQQFKRLILTVIQVDVHDPVRCQGLSQQESQGWTEAVHFHLPGTVWSPCLTNHLIRCKSLISWGDLVESGSDL